jgi:DNA invertase Pin-like site-specific DNA recombinase
MIVGYARTSTAEQLAGLEGQLRDLRAAGCDKIFSEHCSAMKRREKMEQVLEFVREGDMLIVTKLDRLARSLENFLDIVKILENKKVRLKVLGLDFDSSSPTGKFILNNIAMVAQFEREMMLERQRDGIAKAKSEGKYKGKPPLPQRVKDEVLRLINTRLDKRAIAARLEISEGSVYKIVREDKERRGETPAEEIQRTIKEQARASRPIPS